MTLTRALVLTILFCAPAPAQEAGPMVSPQAMIDIDQFQPIPLHEAAALVGDRYAGRLIGADTRPPRPDERALGAELVYRFRLVTPQRTLLDIRIDARSGRFLSVSGRGQLAARRAAED